MLIFVKGWIVEIFVFWNGVGWVMFFDFCGVMLGSGDYLVIVEVVKVLVLEDILCLSCYNFNEVKWFVMLIDVFYEVKVWLICLVVVELEMFYVEGIGLFEFECMVSCLCEM